jgi:Ca-activated chloride channel family protein
MRLLSGDRRKNWEIRPIGNALWAVWGLVWLTVPVLIGGSQVRAQGLMVDRRPAIPLSRSYEIREVRIDADVRDQVAEVQISQTFHNPGSTVLESEFLFPLPEDGAIQNFVLLVDGRELPGKLLTKEEARRIYEEIVRTKRDPALLEYMGRGLYRTSVFPIPPGADRKVTMRYTLLCRRDRDLVEFTYPLSTQKFTAKPIQTLRVDVSIRSKERVKSIYCPSDDASIDRSGEHEARIHFERRDLVPDHDFKLIYSLADDAIGASLLSYRPSRGEDGYFLLLASPPLRSTEERRQPKTVVFVLDRSGSMAGKKIEQARNALKAVLNNLREDDLFNIVVYDDRVESYRPELQRYSSRAREEAERYVDNIREGGSTNIDEALKTALKQIQDDERPGYVLFLTDGLPTAGETRELAIAENCNNGNAHRARVFCFGVGFDVNARLLDRLSGGNRGASEYVNPDEDIEAHVARFSSKLTSPVLADLKIELTGTDLNRTYPKDLPDLFEGGQLVWVGRYTRSGPTTIRISGKVGREHQTLEYPGELATTDLGSSHAFVERLWAVRRLGALIDQIDLQGQNRELVDELVALSTKYGILTPYTSFLADENAPLHTAAANAARTNRSLRELEAVSGPSGVVQRGLKQEFLKADRAQSFSLGGATSESLSHFGTRGSSGMMGMGGMMGQAGGRAAGPALKAGRPARDTRVPGQSPPLAQAPTTNPNVLTDLDSATLATTPTGVEKPRVRQVGKKTFYFKEHHWIDSTVTPDDEARATVIKQFSDAYFNLARDSRDDELNQYLTFEEPVTVKVDDHVYRIEPDDSASGH